MIVEEVLQAEIKEAFDMTAGEGRDYIYASELKLALNYLGMAPKKEDISSVVDEKAGLEAQISLDEFQRIASVSLVALRASSEETIARTFRLYDSEGKGWITQKDLEHVAQVIGEAEDVTEAELHEMFRALDTDNDGRVTEADFQKLFDKSTSN